MSDMPSSVLDYETVATALAGTRPWMSPAELQGLLCGASCALRALSDDAWLQLVWAHAGEDVGAQGLHEELTAFRAAAIENLDAEDFGFMLLLPDDEHALPERVEALAGWCAAFLSGFGLAGGKGDDLDGEAEGALADLGEISRADADADADAEAESDFAALAEYVRVAVLLIRASERAPLGSSGAGDADGGNGEASDR